jgi:hypothetical protein
VKEVKELKKQGQNSHDFDELDQVICLSERLRDIALLN